VNQATIAVDSTGAWRKWLREGQ